MTKAPKPKAAKTPAMPADANAIIAAANARVRQRSHTEHQLAVLQCVADLGDHAYGLLIWELLNKRLGAELPMAQVYMTLNRQAARGYLTKTETRSPVSKSRRVVLFSLTDDGRAALSP